MHQCNICQYETSEKPTRGNTIVEIALWIFFILLFFPIIPIIYSLWRHLGSKVKCPHCGHRSLFIPVRKAANAEEYLSKPTLEEKTFSGTVDVQIADDDLVELLGVKNKKSTLWLSALSGIIVGIIIIVNKAEVVAWLNG